MVHIQYHIDPAVVALVAQDGVARPSPDRDLPGVTHMLYRDRGVVRSCLIADWPATEAALNAQIAAEQTRATKRATLHGRARQGLPIGTDMDALTNPQLLQLIKAMGDALGAFDDDGLLLPPAQWGQ